MPAANPCRAEGKDVLQPISVGESSGLQVGQRVYAIGNPFGLDHTLCVGMWLSAQTGLHVMPTRQQARGSPGRARRVQRPGYQLQPREKLRQI